MYYVYILRELKTNRRYVGYTSNLRKRLEEHLKGQSRYTKTRGGYSLEWYCGMNNKESAIRFEKYLKSSSGHAFTNKHFIKNDGNNLKTTNTSTSTANY